MTKLLAALATTTLIGCTAIVSDPNETVATFSLRSDAAGALLAEECVARHGVEGCTPYPNALECDLMKVAVKADGRTHVECTAGGRRLHYGFATSPVVPFLCKADEELSCQVCLDVFGNTVHDSCNRNAQAFRQAGSGWSNVPESSAFLEEGNGAPPAPESAPPTTPTPPAQAKGACDPANAILNYAAELNKVLAHEGLNVSWVPNTAQFPDPAAGFFSKGTTSCESLLASLSDLDECWSGSGASCHYCTKDAPGVPKVCKCYRVNVVALKAVCKAIPKECKAEKKLWSANLVMAFGVATKWLFSPSYPAFYGKVPAAAALPTSLSQTQVLGGGAATFPTCKGSPLVLDLDGDGIRPTDLAGGVRFDLLGLGPQRTAWVRGDDALLALDRDGNGRIDGGAELFGEATAGIPHQDGFQALARLDANRDGVLDRRDPEFARLLLWNDRNGDGRSDAGELTTLAARGVRSLGLGATRKELRDRHGNDLGLQGSFTRSDGSAGLMVDVYFVAR